MFEWNYRFGHMSENVMILSIITKNTTKLCKLGKVVFSTNIE